MPTPPPSRPTSRWPIIAWRSPSPTTVAASPSGVAMPAPPSRGCAWARPRSTPGSSPTTGHSPSNPPIRAHAWRSGSHFRRRGTDMPITLVLADDHPLILDGLEALLKGEQDFEVLARCTAGDQTLEAVRQHQPDIL